MISPLRLRANRTDICVPGRAASFSGGTQQARSAANIARMVSTFCSASSCLAPDVAGGAGAALSTVRRKSCGSGVPKSGTQGPRRKTLQTLGAQGCRLKTLQPAEAGVAADAIAAAITADPRASAQQARMAALRHFMSAATCTRTMRSGSTTGSPFLILSTTSMPETTSPTTVYLPLRNEPSAYMMKNCEFAEFGSFERAMPTTPRLNGVLVNSDCRLGYFEPPVPLWFAPSPVCAMKPEMTRWNGTLS